MAIQMCENSGQYVWQCAFLSPICMYACMLVCANVCVFVCVCQWLCEGAVNAIFSLASMLFCCPLLLYNFRIRRVNAAASQAARIGLCMRILPRPRVEHFICQALAQRERDPGMHLNEMPSDLRLQLRN